MPSLVRQKIVGVGLVVAAACGGKEPPPATPSATSAAVPRMPAAGTATPAPSIAAAAAEPTVAAARALTDAQIVAVASATDHAAVDMAELAKKGATDADVKNFAAMMITQHRDLENKARALATKVRISPEDSDESAALAADVQATLSTLRSQKGLDFDGAYVASQVKLHRDALATYDDKLLPSAQNGELKAILGEARSRVAAHLAKAEELQAKLAAPPEARTGKPTTK